jgi:hypothetical protein
MAQITLNSTGVASNGSLLLQSNGTTTAVTIDTAQNMGLGVTPSAWNAAIKALEMPDSGFLAFANTNGNISTNAFFDTGYKYKATAAAARYSQSSGQHLWFNAASGTAGNTISFTQAMTLDASGRLGVNVTDPNAPLDIKSGASANAITIRARAGNDFSFLVFRQADGTEDLGGIANQRTAANTGNLLFYTAAGSTAAERARIDSSGGLILAGSTAQKATGTTWSNPSDQRLKDNIRDYAKGTTELMQVRVREWEYNGKGGTTEGMKGLGVIADEVMTVLPDTVENYDAKLNADDEETTAIKKFDATEITWLLVKTVQEQQALITQLQADVAAMKGTA